MGQCHLASVDLCHGAFRSLVLCLVASMIAAYADGAGVSGRQPDGVSLGVADAHQPVSLVCALLLGVELHALVTEPAHHVVEVVHRETRSPPRARTIADPV